MGCAKSAQHGIRCNGTAYTNLTWQNGRQLASLQKGSNTYTYTYDMNGVRSSKTVNGVKHNYITQDGKVIREEYGTTVLEFVYDTNGAPYALRYSSDSGKSWLTYYYVLNLQGDVVKLIYTDGTVRAEYSYNAWGEIFSATNPSSSTVNIQDINPLRYRGYYYDTETGWYYLQSRYYDPTVKRFINADGYASTGQGIRGANMFAYCNNNPVNFSDDGGMRPAYATRETDTGGGGRVYASSKGVTDGRPETKEFYEQNKQLVEDRVEKYGTQNSTYELRYKGRHEVSAATRQKEMQETREANAKFSIMIGLAFGFGVGAVSEFIGYVSSYIDYHYPSNSLMNGIYYEYTLFIDTPCTIYGKPGVKTTVVDIQWILLDGADSKIAREDSSGVCYH